MLILDLQSADGIKMRVPIIFKAITTHYAYDDPKRPPHVSLDLLLEAGANPNASSLTSSGVEISALMAACESCCAMASARMLLAHNCDPWQKTATGRTALHTAARKGCLDVCKLLLDAAGSEPDVRDAYNCTPLSEAVRNGHLAVVELLHAQHGCDVMMRDPKGVTLLHVAAGADKPPMLEYLIRSGVDVNAAMLTAVTPVRVAVQTNNTAAVKTLLEFSASTAAVHDGGDSLLGYAVMLGNADIVEVILSQCKQLAVELNARNADLHTVLHEAALFNRTEAAAVLLRFGAAVDAHAAYGTTPLMVAAEHARSDFVQLLLDAGADITAQRIGGETALHAAAENGKRPEVLQLLLEQDGAAAMINNVCQACSCCGKRTAVMMCEQPAHLKLLLGASADVHITTDRGNTALHVAAVHKFAAPMLCLLIKAGVDLHAENGAGKTAAQVAAESGNKLAAALLTRAARDS
jgi:ankyrin repeat protein